MKKLMLRYKSQISNIGERMAALGMQMPPEKAEKAADTAKKAKKTRKAADAEA